jgi:hypothetical protein
LCHKKPTDTVVEASDEMRELNRQRWELRREKFFIERRIEVLQCKTQVAMGENLGIEGVAS